MRITKPMHTGDTISLTKMVLSKEERTEGPGLIAFETTIVN
jgi:acyl dehydratase